MVLYYSKIIYQHLSKNNIILTLNQNVINTI